MGRSNETSSTNKWMSYLSDNVLLDAEETNANPFFWAPAEQAECSAGANSGPDEAGDRALAISKKRVRDDPSSGNKANREKLRRDRLNDKFLELSQVLDPGRPPKTDKTSILSDAVKLVGQLRAEAQQLQEGSEQLKEQIKELKNEKNELRDEKSRLKAEKEKLEQQLKSVVMPSAYIPHPAAMQVAAAAYVQAQAQVNAQAASAANKAAAAAAGHGPQYSGMPMWQWLPPASVDTSQDHIRHPPVA